MNTFPSRNIKASFLFLSFEYKLKALLKCCTLYNITYTGICCQMCSLRAFNISKAKAIIYKRTLKEQSLVLFKRSVKIQSCILCMNSFNILTTFYRDLLPIYKKINIHIPYDPHEV